MKNRTYLIGALLVLATVFSSCRPCVEARPTGCPIVLNNVYTNPDYPHDQVVNVLLLPIDDPMCNADLSFHKDEIIQAVLRNFGKMHYFNLQYDHHFHDISSDFMSLSTGYVDRLKLGALGCEYNVQAVLVISVVDYRPYPPMQMHVKAMLLDVASSEQLWGFDHVFDFDDANVVNDMRIWWNSHIMGGDTLRNRFDLALVRPSMFQNYVFYRVARSYGESRENDAHLAEMERVAKEEC